MSALWTSADAAAATGGRSTSDWSATGISIDTRTLQTGDLFIALTDHRDGHDFVAQALAKGAAAALVSRIPEGVAPDAPLLIVDNVQGALEALGSASRARCLARVVAVTGSVGKTSTKEMLRAALAGQGRVHAAELSFNNQWGVPLTLARMPADTDYAIIEIGMNHPGEIAPLARLTRPHVALITTIAAAHLEAFADVTGIAHEKASIFEGLEPGGIAVVPADLPTTNILRQAAKTAGATQLMFGTSETADYCLREVRFTQDITVVSATACGQKLLFKIRTPGRHFAMNALATIAVADALGADLALATNDLGLWMPPPGRGARERVQLDPVEDQMTLDLIDDAYNANPTSLVAALEVLAAASPRDGVGRVAKGRRIAVLGDMLELGPTEQQLHADIASYPTIPALSLIHCVGPRMRHLWEALPAHQRGEWYATARELAARAHTIVDAGDVILVKGSKGSRMSLVVDAIRNLGHAVPSE